MKETAMTKEVTALPARRQRKRDSKGLSVLWLFILVLALLGAIVAAGSKTPITLMLVWPAPLILMFTAGRFVREGYHKRDGVLVLGRPEPSFVIGPLDLSDEESAQGEAGEKAEPRPAGVDSLSILGRRERIELTRAIDPAWSRRRGEERKRLDRPSPEKAHSLAHT
jgi:hypothetical protein